ncbi:MAG: hypothetical protein Q8O92_10260 [Candidatus Latescibacter sp.]|nr:hypothetical protein [Candidatus Latescibacter sp.]
MNTGLVILFIGVNTMESKIDKLRGKDRVKVVTARTLWVPAIHKRGDIGVKRFYKSMIQGMRKKRWIIVSVVLTSIGKCGHDGKLFL